MSGETETNVSGWTTDTLNSHISRILEERQAEWNQRFIAQEKAIHLAREADLRQQNGQIQVATTRLDGVEKAQLAFNEMITRVPSDVDKQVGHLQSLTEEKFRSVDREMRDREEAVNLRFAERDVRSERGARDNKIAVDAAFAAAKEAVAEQNKSSALAISKSEAATTKQIDQISVQIVTITKATDDKIDDIKADLNRRRGSDDQGYRTTQSSQWVIGLVVFGASIISSIAIAVLTRIH